MFARTPQFIRTSCVLAAAVTFGFPAAASAQGLPSADPQDIASQDVIGSIAGVADAVNDTVNGRAVTGAPGSGTPTTVRSAPDTTSSVTMLTDGAVREFTTQQLVLQQDDLRFDGYSLSPQTKAGQPGLPTVGEGTGADLGETPLTEVPIGGLAVPDTEAAKITWLLTQSKSAGTDQVVLDRLSNSVTDSVGRATGVDLNTITPQQRSAATQAAVWHFTDDMKLDPANNDEVVTALYDYLIGSANTGAPLSRSAPLTTVPGVGQLPTADQLPAGLASDAGRIAGPFEVDDVAPPLDLDVSGVKGTELVDPSGTPIAKAGAGDQFFLRLPEGATPEKTVVNAVSQPQDVTGRAVTDLGRATHEEPTQLVLSDGPALPVKQPVTLNWVPSTKAAQASDDGAATGTAADTDAAAGTDCGDGTNTSRSQDCEATQSVADNSSDDGGLPLTGVALGGVVVAGLALLAGGGALFWFSRRRTAAPAGARAQ